MRCEVCGKEYPGNGACPVCGFHPVGGFIGELTPELKSKIDAAVSNHKKDALKDISVYAIGYIMQEKEGKIVLDSKEEILIAEDIYNFDLDRIYWSPVEYGKETPGQPMQVDVAVKAPSGNKEYSLIANGPDTKGFWKLGFILKPGFNFAVAVGDSEVFEETNAASLK